MEKLVNESPEAVLIKLPPLFPKVSPNLVACRAYMLTVPRSY